MKQRLLSVILTLMMLLTLTPIPALAADAWNGADGQEIAYETHPGVGSVEDVFPSFSTFGITAGMQYDVSYYNQLDDYSKAVYDAIYADDSPLKAGPTEEHITIIGTNYTDDLDPSMPIVAALGALLYDHPELSWLVNTSFGYGYNQNLKAITEFYMDEEGYIDATTAPEGPVTEQNKGRADTGDREAIMNAISAAKADIGDLSGKSDFEKVKILYDWVCTHMEYADHENDAEAAAKLEYGWRGYQTAYSALVEGVTVCAGYAKAFKLLCDEYQIPCAIITGESHGENHAWNYVQIGGAWYGIDCTWADQSTYVSYDYFLKGSNDFSDHTEGTLYGDYSFIYPKLSEASYTDPSMPDSIVLTYEPSADGAASSGNPYFGVPTVSSPGDEETREIVFAAEPRKDGSAMVGQTMEWVLIGGADGITLEPDPDGTAKLTISSSALGTYDADPDHSAGPVVTVTVQCGTAQASQQFAVFVSHRTASFLEIRKEGAVIAADAIVPGGSSEYTARVYDQYGQEMAGQTVDWSVTGGSGVTVSGGVVEIDADAPAGEYTVTAQAGSANAAVALTVIQTAPVHSFCAEWTSDDSSHWHACELHTDCNEISDQAAHTWDAGTVTREPSVEAAGERTFTCTVCRQTKTESIEPLVLEHTHIWAEAWSRDETHHWHDCTAPNCGVTESCDKGGFEVHIYDSDIDTDCNVCGYTRTTASGDGSGGGSSSSGSSSSGGSLSSGGSPSSGSSDGDSGDDLPASSIQILMSGDKGSIPVSATVSGSEVTVNTPDEALLDTAVESGRTDQVEIDLSGLDGTVQTVNLSVDVVLEIVKGTEGMEGDNGGLSVKLPAAEVSFDGTALKAIQMEADRQISLTVAPADASDLSARQREAVGDAPVFDLTLMSGGKSIHSLGGGRAEVTLPYKLRQGQAPAGVAVYYLDSAGGIAACKSEYDVRTETVVFITNHLSLYFVGYDQTAASENPFVDVSPDAYYYDAVQWATAKEITLGTSETTFGPDDPCTRAQMVTFLWRAAGAPEPQRDECPFMDVPPGAYYDKAVRWAVEQGITTGVSAETFDPDAAVTRAQAVTFLYRAAGSPVADGNVPFEDVSLDEFYADAVGWAFHAGITTGTSAETFQPNGNCTRAQIAAFLYRAQGGGQHE